jgi:hypothetical protein
MEERGVSGGRRWIRRLAVGCSFVFALVPAAARAASSYHSPGYTGTHRVPRVAPVPPPPPAVLGQGTLPHVLVDASGTGHIAWTQGHAGATESVLHYCRLPRGQRQCAAQSSLIPPDNDAGYGNGPATDVDFQGPWPLAVGNELLVLDHRCCNSVPLPDGSSSSDVNFLYTSEDGGSTFTGPGIVGTQAPSGNALIYGGSDPHIGVISDTQTGGTFFQGTPAGAFTRSVANLGNQGPDEAYDGRVALSGTRPIAAFDDLTGHIYVREYSGIGDINDPGNWSVSQFPGWQPRVVSGPSGIWLAYTRADLNEGPWFVRRIVDGAATGAALQITGGNEDLGYFTFTEDGGGELIAGWIDRAASPREVHIRTSVDGVHWSAEQVVGKGPITGGLQLGAAPDGGGYAVFQENAQPGQGEDQIAVSPFGAINANGQKGLGNLDGQGLGGLGGDQFGTTSCTDVHFGAIDALAEAGCFLRDPSNPTSGAAVTDGEIRLNGLEIIPDAGVKIIIDPRTHTINTTGKVSVVLRAPLLGDITIWHDELHVDLAGGLADAGQTLFDFDTSRFPVSLEGFPIEGKIDVQLARDAVVIPISVTLPPYMGGISGAATLQADNANGFELTSLHIGVDDLELGALEIKGLSIDFNKDEDLWAGGATLNIPGGTPYFGITAHVEFSHGQFTMGSFEVPFGPFPGVPIFTDAYLASFGGGFDIRPPRKRFFGSITVGAIPLDPPNYTVTVTGTVSITFTDNGPVILEVDGSGALHGYQIATARMIFQTNGYFEVDGSVDINLDVAELRAGINSFIDLPRKEFSAEVKGDLFVAGYDVAGADSVISSKGVAACGSILGGHVGFAYPWGGSVDIIGPGVGGCDVSGYAVQPLADVAAGHSAPAGVAVAPRTLYEDIAATGSGGPPTVVLRSPSGRQITPASFGTQQGAAAVALEVQRNSTTYVMIPRPMAGTWTVTAAPGSQPITLVRAARGFARPHVVARVTGHGHDRGLSYRVPARPGLGITFAEQARGVYHVLGDARGARGTFRFSPADGPAGERTILAIVSEGGTPRERLAIARYSAPGPLSPGRVRAVRLFVRGRRFVLSFGSAANADRYLVRLTASDGRHLVRLIGRAHRISLPALGYGDTLTVTVTGVSSTGRRGVAVHKRATWTSRVLACAQLPPAHRSRRRC